MSKFKSTSGTTVLYTLDEITPSNYITISGLSLGGIETNSSNDELVLAYSLINSTATPATSFASIESVNFMIEFIANTGNTTSSAQYHFKQTALTALNRYQTIKVSLGTTNKSSNFKWSQVASAKIYASIQDSSGNQLTDYALVLDGLNLNNKNNINVANYGMVAYTPVKNTDATALIKTTNTSKLVEFRLMLGGPNLNA